MTISERRDRVEEMRQRLYTTTEMSEELGVSTHTIRRDLKERGCSYTISEAMKVAHALDDNEEYHRALRLYHFGDKPIESVRKVIGVADATMKDWIRRAGLMRSKSVAQHLRTERKKRKVHDVCRLYHSFDDPTYERVSRECGVSGKTVAKYVHSPMDPYSDSFIADLPGMMTVGQALELFQEASEPLTGEEVGPAIGVKPKAAREIMRGDGRRPTWGDIKNVQWTKSYLT
jgi:transposase